MAEPNPLVVAAWPDILSRLAAGELVRDLLAVHGLSRKQVSAHMLACPAAKAQWDEARESSADALFDEAMSVARTPVDKELAQSARLHVDTLKWAARIRNPRLYGDKTTMDINVKAVDLTRIIQDANARLAAQQQGRIIDATPNNDATPAANAHALLSDAVLASLY